jgi:hypothetical protein
MVVDLSQINILTRLEIEARIAGPLIRAFIDELGRDKAIAVVNRVIKSLAQESGHQLAKQMGRNSMADFARGLSACEAGDAYEMEVLELSETRYFFNMICCRYADMYKEYSITDVSFAPRYKCDYDIYGFIPSMKLVGRGNSLISK